MGKSEKVLLFNVIQNYGTFPDCPFHHINRLNRREQMRWMNGLDGEELEYYIRQARMSIIKNFMVNHMTLV
jgi:hypothetical protein